MVNTHVKSRNGENEILNWFIVTMRKVETEFGITNGASYNVKRRGGMFNAGSDILNVPGLSIEVKRVELEQVDKWWKQCCLDAKDERPVLFFRANNRKWRVRTWTLLTNGSNDDVEHWIASTLWADEFMAWFADHYRHCLTTADLIPQN